MGVSVSLTDVALHSSILKVKLSLISQTKKYQVRSMNMTHDSWHPNIQDIILNVELSLWMKKVSGTVLFGRTGISYHCISCSGDLRKLNMIVEKICHFGRNRCQNI